MSASCILQKQQCIYGFKHDVTIAPHSLVPTILHEFHDSKGHQGTICMFEAILRLYWWPKLWQDIVKYVSKCGICAKHLANMARYPQQHLEILKLPIAVLPIDTISNLPITSEGNRWARQQLSTHVSHIHSSNEGEICWKWKSV